MYGRVAAHGSDAGGTAPTHMYALYPDSSCAISKHRWSASSPGKSRTEGASASVQPLCSVSLNIISGGSEEEGKCSDPSPPTHRHRHTHTHDSAQTGSQRCTLIASQQRFETTNWHGHLDPCHIMAHGGHCAPGDNMIQPAPPPPILPNNKYTLEALASDQTTVHKAELQDCWSMTSLLLAYQVQCHNRVTSNDLQLLQQKASVASGIVGQTW